MSSPPPSSPAASSAEVLTPSRKVKALLARFDDSDSDDGDHSTQPSTERTSNAARHETVDSAEERGDELDDDDDDDDVLVTRKSKSRMAARLDDRGNEESVDSVNERSTHNAAAAAEPSQSPTPPRRRLLVNRKHRSASPSELPHSPASPMFFPSPSGLRDAVTSPPTRDDSDSDLPDDLLSGSKEKLHSLVEKHRKARREREAAEAAKKGEREQAAGGYLDEESDASAEAESDGEKLTQAAKPMRKASKKAREEMARETQRMSRNMQLAHQARTRKTFSKESFLSRFSHSLPTPATPEQQQQQQQQQQQPQSDSRSSPKSSHASSDVEHGDHTTPPTSPLSTSPDSGDLQNVQPPNLGNDEKGKGKALQEPVDQPESVKTAAPPAKSARLREMLSKSLSDSDDLDLEIITEPSELPKYATFEKLASRMAVEAQSHRVLRALAHIHDSNSKDGSPMTMAELDLELKRRARLQAKQERQERIDQLRAMGKDIRTAEEREREQEELEDLVEKARQEAAELQKREKELAKKDGTYVKDGIDSDDSDDEDFDDIDDDDGAASGESEEEGDDEDEDEQEESADSDGAESVDGGLLAEAEEEHPDGVAEEEHSDGMAEEEESADPLRRLPARTPRQSRVIVDDEDEERAAEAEQETESPMQQPLAKTPQSLTRSARKLIPGLNMSEDLPMDLSQAFAATMADSQSQRSNTPGWEADNQDFAPEAPSPDVALIPQLNRLDSLDVVSNSQPSQTVPLDMDAPYSQTERVPGSPLVTREPSASQYTPSRLSFEPTQDAGYVYTPFQGNRFEDTPQQSVPHSTRDTVILSSAVENSPLVERKGRLRRGRAAVDPESEEEEEEEADQSKSAFSIMKRAAKEAEQQAFDKSKSNAREIVDEAAEESDDEYAGLGGASDDDEGVENEDDRRMIDNDTELGQGDEAKLAGHFADRERQEDEAAVNKLMKDLATGALRRKRGAQDDLDLSDNEAEAAARRRKAKQRQFARMQRELLKDEAVGKIAEDKKKEAFLKSIEDQEPVSDDDLEFDQPETPLALDESQSQDKSGGEKRALDAVADAQLNHRRGKNSRNKKPSTLAEIREMVSSLIEEPESQGGVVDAALSDSEDEPEAYVDLDRHLRAAEADENELDDGDGDGLADFIVEDNRPGKETSSSSSSSSNNASRQPFGERRTRTNVVNRVSLLRQSSSTGSSSSSTKMAFYTSSSTTSTFKGPMLLRRATTNSALSLSTGEGVSATGVTVARTERGRAGEEKEFIRKGKGGMRNAVNYRGPATTGGNGRLTVREERMSAREGVVKRDAAKGRTGPGFLKGLFGGRWD